MHANAEVSVERGVPYGHGKLLDIYRPGGGGGHLLASLAFTRERAGSLGGLGEDAIVLAGWSRGAPARPRRRRRSPPASCPPG